MRRQLGCGRIAGCGFALFWTAFVLVFWVVFLGEYLPILFEDGQFRPGEFLAAVPMFPFLFLLLFLLIGLAIGAWSIWQLSVALIVAPAELTLSGDSFKVGEAIQVSYRQQFRRDAEVERIELLLTMKETVHYQRGTETETDIHEEVVDRHVVSGPQSFRSGKRAEGAATLQLPRDGMHTFKASNNKLQWFVKLEMDLQKWADYREERELEVRPVLAGGQEDGRR